ncbi:MAG: DsrH/TusB family sulfur metabolism protein [Chloroflexota bacterium]|nr:DsrH/TusB family sulfur metabolism protein [Chloroflexota bacterium]
MANLYLIDKPFADSALGLAREDPDAEVVLLQDGVYLSVEPLLAARKKVYAVERDVERRGLSSKIGNDVKLIDYHQLVDLLFANKVLNFA